MFFNKVKKSAPSKGGYFVRKVLILHFIKHFSRQLRQGCFIWFPQSDPLAYYLAEAGEGVNLTDFFSAVFFLWNRL